MDAGHLQSKQPRTPLAGLYGHPVHPILITVPIGAWVCALVFDLVSYGSSEPKAWSSGAMWLILLGALGAALAAVFGVIDLSNLPRGTSVRRTAQIHAALNSIALAIFVVSFIWRYTTRESWDSAPIGPVILSILGLALVGVSGWLGGKLAYHYGVRVADESVQAEGFRGTAAPTSSSNPT